MPPCGGCHCRASRCSFLGCRSGETNETTRDFEFLVFSAHPFELEAKNSAGSRGELPFDGAAHRAPEIRSNRPAVDWQCLLLDALDIPPKAFPAGDRIMLPAVRETLLINLPRSGRRVLLVR